MQLNDTLSCRMSYFICANFHASSLEHTKVYEVEKKKSDNHSKNKKKTALVQDGNNIT